MTQPTPRVIDDLVGLDSRVKASMIVACDALTFPDAATEEEVLQRVDAIQQIPDFRGEEYVELKRIRVPLDAFRPQGTALYDVFFRTGTRARVAAWLLYIPKEPWQE